MTNDKKQLSVVSFDGFPPADIETSWDGSAAEGRLKKWSGGPEKDDMDWDKYKDGFTWYDSENKEDFGSYKLPHHDIVDDSIKTIWNGVKAAMGALLGARGGVDIPNDEKDGVYNHLADHYGQFDKEPPENTLSEHDDEEDEEEKENTLSDLPTGNKWTIN